MVMPTKKILLVQLFSNGDCLYASAVARQIKTDFPGCHLTWAVASFCKDIIAGNEYIDERIVVSTVVKNDVAAFRRFRREILRRKERGEWDEVFITQIMDSNQANYDGCIRSAIFNGYPHPITVPVTPLVRLLPDEVKSAAYFAETHGLCRYKEVILFEFAPQSGQSKITKEFALSIAEHLAENSQVAIILSSAQKIDHPSPGVIDGSSLSFRETAALSHYCTLLIGCSSGITWISTSYAAKQLPMIQLLDPDIPWINAVSRDFRRFGLAEESVIELTHFDENSVTACTRQALEDFGNARKIFNQPIPLHFRTTVNIVYNLLCYCQFSAIFRHVRLNRKVYGDNMRFYMAVAEGFLIFPFRLTGNIWRKRILKSQKS
jgi:ADP-heptose:LPS heptosyltransferase